MTEQEHEWECEHCGKTYDTKKECDEHEEKCKNTKELFGIELKDVTEGLPEGVKKQIQKNEKVYYFSYISYKGGCFSSSNKKEYWIALTDKRVLYKAKVKEDNDLIEKDGILPFEKVSFIEVTEKKSSGCSSSQSYGIRISTSGGTVFIPIPTKEKGYEIRETYSKIENNRTRSKNRGKND